MADTPLLVVCGPTASGKTGLAVALAKHLDGEVVSADSMQVYRRMNIGTAKPTAEEMDGVVHHLIDILEPGDPFSVASYCRLAKDAIQEIAGRGRLPILAGGTGLYIDSVTNNIEFVEMEQRPALRRSLRETAEREGNDRVWRMLRDCDPELAASLHPNNLGRVIRAIEVFQATETPLSEWQRRSRLTPPAYRLCMLGLHWEREALYRRIDLRVEQMLERGLVEEARALYAQGLCGTAGQAIGYKELYRFFDGEISLAAAEEKIKRETRRYAKRQMTWLRRDERIHWLDAEAAELTGTARTIAREMLRIG